MDQRSRMMQEGLDRLDLDALVGWRTEELVMLAGCFPHFGASLCLFTKADGPVIYTPAHEPEVSLAKTARRRVYQPASEAPWASLRSLLQEDLQKLGLREGRVGIAGDQGKHALPGNAAETPPLTEAVVHQLLKPLTVCADANIDSLWTEMFLYKTEADVAGIQLANTVAAEGIKRFYQLAGAGRSEAEVAGQVEAAIQSQTGRAGCRSARAWAFVQAGEHAAQAGMFSRSSGTLLAQGDMVVLELATCVDGYWSDLTRTAVVGTPNPAQQALLDAVRSAQSAAIAVVCAGITHADVDRAARQVLEERGFGAAFSHATGHHVGFRYHDAGPMLAPGSTARLHEGMVITIEPGAYGPAGGARFEENVLVTEDGCVVLSPQSLTA